MPKSKRYMELKTANVVDQRALRDVLFGAVPAGLAGGTLLAALRELGRGTGRQSDSDDEDDQLNLYRKNSGWFSDTLGGAASGANADSPSQLPYYLPLLAAAGLGSAGVGHKLTSGYFDKLRKQRQQAELEQAQAEYEQALSDYRKSSGEVDDRCELAKDMDRIIECFEKTSEYETYTQGHDTEKLIGSLLGLIATGALGVGSIGAYHGFKSQRKNSPARAAERAQLEQMLDDQDKLNPTAARVV